MNTLANSKICHPERPDSDRDAKDLNVNHGTDSTPQPPFLRSLCGPPLTLW
jgi:hypothetical protein